MGKPGINKGFENLTPFQLERRKASNDAWRSKIEAIETETEDLLNSQALRELLGIEARTHTRLALAGPNRREFINSNLQSFQPLSHDFARNLSHYIGPLDVSFHHGVRDRWIHPEWYRKVGLDPDAQYYMEAILSPQESVLQDRFRSLFIRFDLPAQRLAARYYTGLDQEVLEHQIHTLVHKMAADLNLMSATVGHASPFRQCRG